MPLYKGCIGVPLLSLFLAIHLSRFDENIQKSLVSGNIFLLKYDTLLRPEYRAKILEYLMKIVPVGWDALQDKPVEAFKKPSFVAGKSMRAIFRPPFVETDGKLISLWDRTAEEARPVDVRAEGDENVEQ